MKPNATSATSAPAAPGMHPPVFTPIASTRVIRATGFAEHHFWGDYSAQLCLLFHSAEDAAAAIPILNAGFTPSHYRDACGRKREATGWLQGIKTPHAAWVTAADPALEGILDTLVSYGAARDKILSLAKSVDHGERYFVEIPVPVETNEAQGELF